MRSISSAETPVAFRLEGGSIVTGTCPVTVRLSVTNELPETALFWITE